jgi:hypothetical protein
MLQFAAALLALVLAAAPVARATVAIYADRAAFEAAVGSSLQVETFDELPVQTLTTAGSIHTPSFDFTVVAPTSGGAVGVMDVGGSRGLVGEVYALPVDGDRETFTFGQPIRALGFDVTSIEGPGLLRLIVLPFGPFSAFDTTTTGFFGIILDTPFTTAEIVETGSVRRRFVLDNVGYAVPEPASLALLALVLLAKRKRPASAETGRRTRSAFHFLV